MSVIEQRNNKKNSLYSVEKNLVQIEHKERLQSLWEVAKLLAAENQKEKIVSIIVSQVTELLDAGRCTLYFVDTEKRELIVHRGASHGRQKNLVSWIFGQYNAPELPFEKDSDEFRFPMDKGIAGYVATTGKCLNLEDAHEHPRFEKQIDYATGYHTRSMLCVPMKDSNNEVIGVVQAINKNPLYNRFDEEDETLLNTFSALAALAVRNSQLWERTQNALKTSEAMLEVTKALSSELQMEALIKIIVVKVQNLVNSERCTVFLVDQEKREMYTSESMSYGMAPPIIIARQRQTLRYFPMDQGIAGSVASTGVTVRIADAYQDPRFNRQVDIETKFRTKSILCMAIRNRSGAIIGVLQCMNKIGNKGLFSEQDEKLLEAFSAQAAIAIDNSRLFQQTERLLVFTRTEERKLNFMLSVTRKLFSTMHLTSVNEQITLQVNQLLNVDDCALYLVNQQEGTYYLAKDDSDSIVHYYTFDQGIVGYVASSGQVVRISNNAMRDSRFHPEVDQRRGKTTHSILCCPIFKTENGGEEDPEVIGVISVRDEKDRGGFEPDDEKLLKVFCAQAAVAIVSNQKFNALVERKGFSKNVTYGASDRLRKDYNMHLPSGDIEKFDFKMDEIEIQKSIGTGSFGEVFRALVRKKVVAVKKLHARNLTAQQIDAFAKEAALMCQLTHPNIVQFVGAVTDPQNLCIITQFCDRGSLADLLLDKTVAMPQVLKLKFALDAARGMCYLHLSNPIILHRDLKSDNLLVSKDWTVKVADFGLTRFLNERKTMTQVGTPMWMAPEVIMGKQYSEKADVYAFGIILWEILTREEPYHDKETMQIVVEVVNDDLRPELKDEYKNNALVPLMKDCWHKDPEQRPIFKVIVERLEQMFKQETKDESN